MADWTPRKVSWPDPDLSQPNWPFQPSHANLYPPVCFLCIQVAFCEICGGFSQRVANLALQWWAKEQFQVIPTYQECCCQQFCQSECFQNSFQGIYYMPSMCSNTWVKFHFPSVIDHHPWGLTICNKPIRPGCCHIMSHSITTTWWLQFNCHTYSYAASVSNLHWADAWTSLVNMGST